jgi:hypothetical protein
VDPKEFLAEFLYPARSLATLLAMLVFYALLLLAIKAGFLGIWLAIVIIPALFRFLIIVAERRANGLEVEAPGIELFSLGGNLWTLFPTVPIAALLVSAAIAANWGMAGQLVLAIGWLTIFPTIMAVLVITNSLLQSLNPQAWLLFIRSTGANYLYAPLILVLAACVLLLPPIVPLWLRLLLWLYLARPSKISGTSTSRSLARNSGEVLERIMTGELFLMSTFFTTARIDSPFLK